MKRVFKKLLWVLALIVFMSADVVFSAVSDSEFILICRRGSPSAVEDAIKSGANVNAEAYTLTPLTAAILFNTGNELQITKILVANGANVNVRSSTGSTALMLAKSQFEIVKVLIANGAKPGEISQYPYTEEFITYLSQYPECRRDFDATIKRVKDSYWGDYSQKNGYPSLGKAFNAFFSKPKWAIGGFFNEQAVVFTGIAKSDGKNAMVKIFFVANNNVGIRMKEFTVNGKRSDWSDLLAAVYLD